MLCWSEFKQAAPEIGAVGEELLYNLAAGEVAILATVDRLGRPAVAPFCPIFMGRGMYLLASAKTPKVRHLRENSSYAMHALLGAQDLEFQLAGVVRPVAAEIERRAVLQAVPFDSFDVSDPIFEFLIRHGLTVNWPEPGKRQRLSWSY